MLRCAALRCAVLCCVAGARGAGASGAGGGHITACRRAARRLAERGPRCCRRRGAGHVAHPSLAHGLPWEGAGWRGLGAAAATELSRAEPGAATPLEPGAALPELPPP
jgi:hypothetical protein